MPALSWLSAMSASSPNHCSTSPLDEKHLDFEAYSLIPTRLVCESLWYPNQKPGSEASLKASATNLIAAVALATKTRSKWSGSALKKRRSFSRVASIRNVDRFEDGDAECGLPNKLLVSSWDDLSTTDFAYGVMPPWSRYTTSVSFVRASTSGRDLK